VIAHEAFASRASRYRAMNGQISIVNHRQFGARRDMGISSFSEDFAYPNTFYREELDLEIGGMKLLIRHGRGETDDHSWLFFPEARILCTGDFFIWAMPNAGNPQKVQRYALEWAGALRRMAVLKPEILSPGHGLPILGQARVLKALEDTARFLENLSDQVLRLMNKGLALQEIIESVLVPPDLLKPPYLQPAYDEAEFLIRNIWRLYAGWYDGIPSHLKPASEQSLAEEILLLVGGLDRLTERVEELLAGGDIRLATHFAEWAYRAAPKDRKVALLMKRVYQERAEQETSIMAKGVYLAAANEIE
jgi:alkyl sulfatase BDS1-like metallo-beta-lactamase superfamily hydrolase